MEPRTVLKEEEIKQYYPNGGDDEDEYLESQRKSTLQKFSKEVFINRVQIIDHRELGDDDHVSYVLKVRGRTKYLVNVGDLA